MSASLLGVPGAGGNSIEDSVACMALCMASEGLELFSGIGAATIAAAAAWMAGCGTATGAA